MIPDLETDPHAYAANLERLAKERRFDEMRGDGDAAPEGSVVAPDPDVAESQPAYYATRLEDLARERAWKTDETAADDDE